MTNFSIYNWRILIFKSNLPANAKYIGCYLSTYMNEHGDNCYPSIARICHETCLTKPTVIKYIHILQSKGWLETKKKGFDGQAWAHNQYYPNIPKKVVKEIYHEAEGGKTDDRRRLNSSSKAVKEVNTSSIDNSTESSTVLFDSFWESYPKKVDKKKAVASFKRLSEKEKKLAIQDSSKRFVGTDKKFILNPTTYLNGARWEDESSTINTANPWDGAI